MRSYSLIIIVIFIFLTSCGSRYIYKDFLNIHKGQSIESLTNEISDGGYEDGIRFISENYNDDYYDLEKYDANILISFKYYHSKTDNDDTYYIFAFINDELTFWGLPYEFANHSNPDIKEIGVEASNIIIEKYMED